jgi:DNA-binding PadR family transcriptional regulator
LVEQLQATGLPIEAGTLYPLLRRLEQQGLLSSTWRTTGTKPRKYYSITEQGITMLSLLTDQWTEMTKAMVSLLKGRSTDEPKTE